MDQHCSVIKNAILATIDKHNVKTTDIGGSATTAEFMKRVTDEIELHTPEIGELIPVQNPSKTISSHSLKMSPKSGFVESFFQLFYSISSSFPFVLKGLKTGKPFLLTIFISQITTTNRTKKSVGLLTNLDECELSVIVE